MRDRAALMPLSVSVSCLLALAASPAHADPFSPELDPASQVFFRLRSPRTTSWRMQ